MDEVYQPNVIEMFQTCQSVKNCTQYKLLCSFRYSSESFLMSMMAILIIYSPKLLLKSNPILEFQIAHILYVLIAFFTLMIWAIKLDINSVKSNFLYQDIKCLLPQLQITFQILLAIFVSYGFIIDVINTNKSSHHVDNVTPDSIVYVTFVPILGYILLNDTSIVAVIISMCISFISIACSILWLKWSVIIPILVIYMVSSIIILKDSLCSNWILYYQRQKLNKEANQALVEANELRGMIANIAHDLKTPLTAVFSGMELLNEITTPCKYASEKEELQNKFSTIKNCIESTKNIISYMTSTINRCLDYTMASKGSKLVPKYETVNWKLSLNDPIHIINDIDNSKSESEVKLIINNECAIICPYIITDPQWLQENVLSLLSNAVKYSLNGNVEVHVSLDCETSRPVQSSLITIDRRVCDYADKIPAIYSTIATADTVDTRCSIHEIVPNYCDQFIKIEVKDTSKEINDEEMKNLFNPFKQAQRLAGGAGLGLFTMAKRMEALHGKYGVRHRDDGLQGSIFWFSFPYRPDQKSADCSSGSIASDRRKHNFHTSVTTSTAATAIANVMPTTYPIDYFQSLRVLLIDDSASIQKMTKMILERNGFIVQQAMNGAEGLQIITDYYDNNHTGISPFDIVLMDLQMPVMDGLEAIRRIRALESIYQITKDKNHIRKDIESNTNNNVFHQYIIAISAFSTNDPISESQLAGADKFMNKPFSIETFKTIVHDEVLKDRKYSNKI